MFSFFWFAFINTQFSIVSMSLSIIDLHPIEIASKFLIEQFYINTTNAEFVFRGVCDLSPLEFNFNLQKHQPNSIWVLKQGSLSWRKMHLKYGFVITARRDKENRRRFHCQYCVVMWDCAVNVWNNHTC